MKKLTKKEENKRIMMEYLKKYPKFVNFKKLALEIGNKNELGSQELHGIKFKTTTEDQQSL